jgi:hypothetical protein
MSTEAAPRHTTAIAFLIAGAAVLLAMVIYIAQIDFDSRGITYVAMCAAFVMLARTELTDVIARAAALFSALGWLILAIFVVIPVLPGIVPSSAYFVIAASSIALGVVIVTQQQLLPSARRAMLATLTITVLYMASAFLVSYFSGPVAALLTVLLGVALLITGYFLYTRR